MTECDVCREMAPLACDRHAKPRYIIRKGWVNLMCDDGCAKMWHVGIWLPVMDYPSVLEVVNTWEEARDTVMCELITG